MPYKHSDGQRRDQCLISFIGIKIFLEPLFGFILSIVGTKKPLNSLVIKFKH